MRIAIAIGAAAALCAGCVSPAASSSAWAPGPPRPPFATPARVLLVADPASAEEIGVVETHGPRDALPLEALVAELASRAASLGADVVRVDQLATRYELVPETYTYACGTETCTETEVRTVTKVDPDGTPRTESEIVTVTKEKERECTGTRMVEAAVRSLVGRAFRTKGGPP